MVMARSPSPLLADGSTVCEHATGFDSAWRDVPLSSSTNDHGREHRVPGGPYHPPSADESFALATWAQGASGADLARTIRADFGPKFCAAALEAASRIEQHDLLGRR